MSKTSESQTVHIGFRARHIFYAFLGGAAAGVVTALLTAPENPARRAWLRATGKKGIEKAQHLPEAIKAGAIAAEEAFVAALEQPPPAKGKQRAPTNRHSAS